MHSLLRLLTIAFFLGCLILGGCSGCNRPATIKVKDKDKPKSDDTELAREQFRAATEAAHFRDVNLRVDAILAANPELLKQHAPGTQEKVALQSLLKAQTKLDVEKLDEHNLYRKFLGDIASFEKTEIDEVEQSSFALLDAHYLEECHVLREVVRSMPLAGLTPQEQAEYCFGWVTRNVVLQEPRDELLPPMYVLRRGQGSAAERVLVMIALLQQVTPAQSTGPFLNGCLIALPTKSGHPRPWLAGVLVTSGDSSDIYLFDPRLGMAVPGPKGKGIATLAQLRVEPALLEGFKTTNDAVKYDVDPKDVGQAEMLLVFPISALSARMRYLQDDLLYGFDRVRVTVRPAELMERFEKSKAGPVRVWTGLAAKEGASVPSPTRAPRLLLPPEEGGIDRSKKLQALRLQVFPGAAILQGYANLGLSNEELPSADAQQQLGLMAEVMWRNYVIEPGQQLLRGRLDDCTRRIMRAQRALDEVVSVKPTSIAPWRKAVLAAYVSKDPGKIAKVWDESELLKHLLTAPDEDFSNLKQPQRGLLSDIVLGAISEPLRQQCNYLLALRWQEKAERLSAQVAQAVGANANTAEIQLAKKEAVAAWGSAAKCWSDYAHDNPLTLEHVRSRLEALNKQAKSGRAPWATSLRQHYLWLVRQAAAGRILQARALQMAGDKHAAETLLQRLATDLEALEKEPGLGLGPVLFWPRYTAQLGAR